MLRSPYTPRLIAWATSAVVAASGLVACSSDPATPADSGVTSPDVGGQPLDSGAPAADAAEADAGFPDAAEADLGVADTGAGDAGVALTPSFAFGQHVTVAEGRVAIGDRFDAVRARLGRGTRSAQAGTRSYEWQLSGGTVLTVWFVNANVDDDDDPPGDVDDTDTVLWVAVSGGYTGRSADGLGLGSTTADVQRVLGAAPSTTALTNPPGELRSYYTRGALVALAPGGTVRTITVSRAYTREPDGRIDLTGAQLDFGNNRTIRSGGLITSQGTSESAIKQILGEPDASGSISVGGLSLFFMNYSFLGTEMFLTRNGRTLLFTSVHTPWYGTTGSGTPGLGAPKAQMEAHLSTLGLGAGVASTSQPQTLTCYPLPGRSSAGVGVTYGAMAPNEVTTIILGIVMTEGRCP
jgi:hypothetical protein